MRRSPRAGGGIVSTVKATRAATLDELVEASRPRLRALMAGGVTTVEIKSGYGLDIETELKMLQGRQGARRERDGAGRADPARAPRPAARIRGPARGVRRARDRFDPAGRRDAGARRARSMPFAKGSASPPTRSRMLFEAAAAHGLRVKLHAEQLSNLHGAALAADYEALSADHLEHADEDGRRGDGAGRHGRGAAARRLLCAEGDAASRRSTCCAATACRWRWRPTAIPAPRRYCRRLDDVDGLHPVRPDAGGGAGRHDPRRARRRWACRTRSARSAPARPPTSASGGSAGRPSFATGSECRGPERRIVAGRGCLTRAVRSGEGRSDGLPKSPVRRAPSSAPAFAG